MFYKSNNMSPTSTLILEIVVPIVAEFDSEHMLDNVSKPFDSDKPVSKGCCRTGCLMLA